MRKARFRKYPILRVRHAFRNNSQARLRNLGITGILPIDELVGGWENVVNHFEPMLAENGWTWAGYGSDFVIDHVLPMVSFDLHYEDQMLACFHWKNLRPLDPFENGSKSASYNPSEHHGYMRQWQCAA
jgi:hypothetical protein